MNKFYSKISLVVYAVFANLWLGACSDSSDVAGNSAETGSPELAGVLLLDDGTPASFARVRLVGSHFDYYRGDDLGDVVEIIADSLGIYQLDTIPDKLTIGASLEVFHESSGKRLLLPNFAIKTDTSLADTLQAPGSALVNLEGAFEADEESIEGLKGEATITGTTFRQRVVVKDSAVFVDSLPVGKHNLVIHLFGKDTLEAEIQGLNITPADTVVFDTVPESVRFSRTAPLLLPESVGLIIDSAGFVITDFPMVLRLDSTNMDFSSFSGRLGEKGRFEVYRKKTDGKLSNSLPISIALMDTVAKKALFWVRLDSLNQEDSLMVTFDSEKEARYAADVFPKNASINAVYHFDEAPTENLVLNSAENQNVCRLKGSYTTIDGVVGKAYESGALQMVYGDDCQKMHASVDSISFGMWVRLEDLSSTSQLFSETDSYEFFYDSSKGFVFSCNEIADSVFSIHEFSGGKGLVKKGEWTHVAFQRRGAWVELFVNGVKVEIEESKNAVEKILPSGISFDFAPPFAVDEMYMGHSFWYAQWVQVIYENQKPNSLWPHF
ncbi:MAG: hypothetical protein HUK21_05830 [Fibrobacteraceae bacterium]|nr:hypothetical protein [Fibrobacteraceae bacterium]